MGLVRKLRGKWMSFYHGTLKRKWKRKKTWQDALKNGRWAKSKLVPKASFHVIKDRYNWFFSVRLSSHIMTDWYSTQEDVVLGRYYVMELRFYKLDFTCGLYRQMVGKSMTYKEYIKS